MAVDHTSGGLSDTRTRFLGAKPVRLYRTVVQGVPALLALSTRSWLAYVLQGRCVWTFTLLFSFFIFFFLFRCLSLFLLAARWGV